MAKMVCQELNKKQNQTMNLQQFSIKRTTRYFIKGLLHKPFMKYGNAPTIWAIIYCFIMTTVRRLGFRTNPQGQRVLANQVHQVFDILFCSYSY